MADIESNIRIDIDTTAALANLRNLQAQLSSTYTQMSKGSASVAAKADQLQQKLINSINASGKFSAQIRNIQSTTETFTTALERNKLSMGQYFRYAGASTKTFGKLFGSEFQTIEKVARERVKSLQTQYIKLGRDANGAMKAIAVRPLALDMDAVGTKTAMAAQRMQLFNQLIKQGSTNLLNWGKNTQWAGRQLMVGFTIPLGIAGTMAAREFMKLEEQAIRFKRVYGDTFTPTAEADAMIEQVKELALEFTKYGVAVEKTMGIAADAAAMGLQGADLTAQVAEATRLAVLGGVEQAQALETTISLTNAFGTATEELANKANFLNAVENQTVTSIEDLTIAIPKAGPVIQQLGGDVEDLAFFLTAMKEGGINASEGANALKSGLASLINPTGVASKMLAGFGINIQEIVNANKGDVKGVVIDFAKALDTLDPLNRAQAIEQLFGKFQFARLSTLFQNVIKEGSQASRVLELTNATTAELAVLSERELRRIEDSPMYQFKAAVEEFRTAMAPVGEEFLKMVTPIIKFGTEVLNKFNELDAGVKQFIVTTVGIGGILAPALIMVVGLIANFAATTIKAFVSLRNIYKNAGNASKILGDQTDYMTQQELEAGAAASSLDQKHSKLIQTFTSEREAVNLLAAAYERAAKKSAKWNQTTIGLGTTGVGGKKPKKYANGVVSVPGSGRGDKVPAMLEPGEAVIPRDYVKKYAPLIDAMVAGTIPGYKKGRSDDVRMYGEYNLAFQEQSANMGQRATRIANTDMQLAPLTMRIAEARGMAITKESVGRSFKQFNKIAKEFEGVTERFVNLTNDNFKALKDQYDPKDSEKRMAKARQLAAQQLLPDIEQIQSKKERDIVKRTFGAKKDFFSTIPTSFNRGANSRKAGYDPNITGVRSYTKLVAGAKALYEGRTGQSAAGFNLAHGGQEKKTVSLSRLARDPMASSSVFTALRNMLGEKKAQRIWKETAESREGFVAKPKKKPKIKVAGSADKLSGPLIYDPVSGNTFEQDKYEKQLKSRETARKRLANMARRTDPSRVKTDAFGIPLQKPSVTAGMQDYVMKRFNQNIAKQQPTQFIKGAGFEIAKNNPAMLQARSLLGQAQLIKPANMLDNVMTKLRSNFAATTATIKSSSIANSKLTTSVKQFGTSAKNAASSIASGTKQLLAAGKAKFAEMGTGGKLAAVGGVASGALMAASMMEGPIGDIASKAMMPVMAASMLVPALAGLGPVLGTVIAALGALAVGGFAFVTAMSDASKKARELAETLGTGNAALDKIAEAAGTTTATEIMNRRRQDDLKSYQVQEGKSTFGESFIQSEAGKGITKGIQDVLKSGTMQDAQALIVQQMTTAVASGALSADQARSVVASLADELGDASFGIQVNGELLELLGPNGENLLTDPIGVRVRLIEEGGARVASSAEALNRTGAASTGQMTRGVINAGLGGAVGTIIGSMAGGAIGGSVAPVAGTIIGALAGLAYGVTQVATAAVQLNESAATFNATGVMAIQQQQQMLDSLQLEYEQRIQIAKAAGDTAEAERLTSEYIAGRQDLITAGNETVDTLVKQFELADGLARDAMGATLGDIIDNMYKDNPLLQQAAIGAKDAIIGATGLNPEQEYQMKLYLASGNVDPVMMLNLMSEFGEDTKTMNAIVNLMSNLGTADGNRAMQIANMFVDENGKPVPDLQKTFYANFEGKNYDDAVQYIGMFEEIQKTGEVGNFAFTMEFFLENEDKALEVYEQAQKMKDLTKDGPVTVEMIYDIVGADVAAIVKANQDYFNSLPADQQVTYTTIIRTLVEQQGEKEFDKAATAWLKSQGLKGIKTTNGLQGKEKERMDMYLNAMAERVTKANVGLAGQAFDEGAGADTGAEPTKDPTSMLDDVVKKIRDVRNAAIGLTDTWRSSMDALMAFARSGFNGFSGLENQLRGFGAGEDAIDMITGMSKEDWDKYKTELFVFDNAGNIAGVTQQFNALNYALKEYKIGRFVSDQEKAIEGFKNQQIAMRKLTSAGMSYADAAEAVQDIEFARAIATNATTEELAHLTRVTREAEKATKDYAAIQAIANKTQETTDRRQLIARMIQDTRLTDAQKEAILGDDNIARLYLDPTISPELLDQALADAQQAAKLELDIKKLTFKGLVSIFEDGFSKAMEAFAVREKEIELRFDIDRKPFEDMIQGAQEMISDITNAPGGLDDLNAELERISRIEEDVNKKYDTRIQAIDQIAAANERVARQQQSQLTLADALTRGDISAAAAAAQEMRAQQTADAIAAEKEALDAARKIELENIMATMGLTREQIETRIRDLKTQILEIEESIIEPAQYQIELLDRQQQLQIDSLLVLGKSKDEWTRISNQVDIAKISTAEYIAAMEQALAVVKDILSYWEGLERTFVTTHNIQTVYLPPIGQVPTGLPGGTGVAGTGGGGTPTGGTPTGQTPTGGQSSSSSGRNNPAYIKGVEELTRIGAMIGDAGKFNQAATPFMPKPSGMTQAELDDYRSFGNIGNRLSLWGWNNFWIPKYNKQVAALRAFAGAAPFKEWDAGGSRQWKNQYKASGGLISSPFSSLGSDTVPTILTPGEFVIKRASVRDFGVDNLKAINNGTFSGGSVYNYDINVSVKSDANPDEIARSVMAQIRRTESQRIRGNRF